MLVQQKEKQIDILKLENELLAKDQADCPVVHHFGEGIYMREVFLKAGLFVLGHRHKKSHTNIMTQGRLLLINDDYTMTDIQAPFIKTTPAGRKAAFILEDTSWINVYATDEMDVEKLEKKLFDKSHDFIMYERKKFALDYNLAQNARDDYKAFLKEKKLSEETVKTVSENKKDQMKMPKEWLSSYSLRESPIHGIGIFASHDFKMGQIIGPARIDYKRTPFGRFINHHPNPNCFFDYTNNNDIYLFSIRDIKGCVAGDHGEELTVNYRDYERFLCQE